ncbi:MAG TPA: outer membrane protein assembly factor BamA [Gemmatimonadales bacterium]|nr:outer membrane protein assembly factor BamA [Gemmatimonadales bacterium]
MRGITLLAAALLAALPASALAQGGTQGSTVIDSIAVVGAHRVSPEQIINSAGIPTGKPVSYLDVQRAITALFGTGQFSDVRVTQGTVHGKVVLRILVTEQPLLTAWSLTGVQKVAEHTVRGKVKLRDGRPYDPAAAAQSVAAIDSLYHQDGYYIAAAKLDTVVQPDSSIHAIINVTEGHRVAISEMIIKGNKAFTDKQIVSHMKTGPEGFWWFQRGEYDEGQLQRDIEERLPDFYAANGYIDFRVVSDTLIVPPGSPKAILELTVDEGPRYVVGNFDILGNRRFSTQDLDNYYPFGSEQTGFLGLGGNKTGPPIFSQSKWDDATQAVQTLYANNGYLYASVEPQMTRRVDSTGEHTVDLAWQIAEGQPATINRVEIRGNTITHEGVIRRATIPLVPGDVFRQNALIAAYRSVSNLGFFQQPLDIPKIERANDQGDVNVIFNVQERHTGSVNFGASVGQGTGVGGFVGLDEPNVFGRGKKVSLQWQFGQNISQFNVSYTDPAIRGGLMSGSISLQSSTLRYTIADLGQIRTRGGTVQLGFPIFGLMHTRLLTSYTLNQNNYDSPTISSRYYCKDCILSSFAVSVVHDTRYNLPFPTGGSLHSIELSQNGGVLGGTGNFQRLEVEGRWYAPLANFGGAGPGGEGGMTLVLALKARSGFVWGDPGPNFQQLFAMGGTQYGIPLRGYDEFSITPNGFDPTATTTSASTVNAFGRSYFASTAEVGLRLSQALYLSTFFDAGNVWATPSQYDPTRLFRGAGIGISVVSPLGPLGIDYAYGFDRTDIHGNPAPGWKLHFKIGNFF